jgi:hypothetical protein
MSCENVVRTKSMKDFFANWILKKLLSRLYYSFSDYLLVFKLLEMSSEGRFYNFLWFKFKFNGNNPIYLKRDRSIMLPTTS